MNERVEISEYFGDVAAESLLASIPDAMAKEAENYLVEYGIRFDDGVLVFHFFPSRQDGQWDPDYCMDRRLERAVAECFDTTRVSADYAEEVRSFCIRVFDAVRAPDPLALVPSFFEAIERPL